MMENNKIVRPKSICVQSLNLLYEIADMGFLDMLNGVAVNKYHPNRRVYYFDQDPEIQKAVDTYIAESRAKKDNESDERE